MSTQSAVSTTRRLTHVDLLKKKAAGEKVAVLTCYDASFAALCDAAGVDALLIGDSLGMVLQGHFTCSAGSISGSDGCP